MEHSWSCDRFGVVIDLELLVMLSFEKRECQKAWAKNKYLVLAKSQSIYREIREYLKGEHPDFCVLESMMQDAMDIPDDTGTVVNALAHVWGYFKKSALEEEKRAFLVLLKCYAEGTTKKEQVLAYLYELLEKYPNEYLQRSNFFDSVK